MKRKQKFAIQTNRMSDEVYEFLLTKVESNQLSRYLIGLVEQDLENGLANERMTQLHNELDGMFKTLSQMKHLLHPPTATTVDTTEESLIVVKQVSDDEINLDAEVDSFDLDF